jgi:hypothetical protein
MRTRVGRARKIEQLMQFRVPANLSEAIAAAAKHKVSVESDFIRQLVIDRLQADGIDPAKLASRDAGALNRI